MATRKQSGFLVQSTHGIKGNFELVVPAPAGDGMVFFWRNNDVGSLPWNGPTCFGSGNVEAVSLIQSNFGSKGNLEVVARVGNRLNAYWRMDHSPWTWSAPNNFASGVRGAPALIQSNHGTKGNFELVTPLATGGLAHYWRNNDAGGYPWSGPFAFGSGTVDAVALIQGNFGSKGNLEVVVREGDRLAAYWRMDHAPWTWHGPYYFASGVRGTPSLIQSKHGTKGNFELVVPLVAGGLAHFWRNNDAGGFPWNGPFRFGSGNIDAVSLIQGNFGSTGNLEVVAREGDRLAFYWRMDHAPWTWSGPFYIGTERAWSVSECVYGWDAKFLEEWASITVRLQLNPDAGITAAVMDTLRTRWRNGIINKWSNRFACRAPNGERRNLVFDVQWVNSNPHHAIRVRTGPARSNMSTWDTEDTGDVASHEFGHMLGLPDEYADGNCPGRNPVNTGTVMDDNTEVVERQVEGLCGFICGQDAVPV